MFAIKRRELGRIVRWKSASRRIFWIVKPKANVERIRRRQGNIRIEAEYLVKKNRSDPNVAIVAVLSDLDIGLIPSETEAARESRVRDILAEERTALDCEEIEGQTRLESIKIED